MTDDGLTIEQTGEVVHLTLSRPKQRNALTIALAGNLADAISDHRSARAIVITGAPPAFCAGGDLDDLLPEAKRGAAHATQTIYGQFHRVVLAIASASGPVIAAINGPALGAGFDLAMACDLRLASSDATFASSWIHMGLVPGMGGAFTLPNLIGSTRAAELLLTGRRCSVRQAFEWGLVNEVVDPNDLSQRVSEWASEIVALDAQAVARTKESLRRGIDEGLSRELATLGAVQGGLLSGEGFSSAVARFKQRSAERPTAS